jgi:hypothetical protein
MSPLGKPANLVTLADIERLIADGVPEGRHLEYKRDIPISDEEQKRVHKEGNDPPSDRPWGQVAPDHGSQSARTAAIGD